MGCTDLRELDPNSQNLIRRKTLMDRGYNEEQAADIMNDS